MALVHLSRTITKANCNEFVSHERQIIPTVLKLNGKASWDSTLRNKQAAHIANMEEERTWKRSISQRNSDRTPVYFQCPKCTHIENSSCKAFQVYDLDKKQKCNGCETLTQINIWKCQCSLYWHNCSTHRYSVGSQQKICTKRNPEGRTAISSSINYYTGQTQ